MINANKIVRLIYFCVFGIIIDSLQTFSSKTLTFYLNYDNKIDFKDIRKIQLVTRIFVWHYIYIFSYLPIYRHSCIVYLWRMRSVGVLPWLLVSLVVCLESLHGQSSITLAP